MRGMRSSTHVAAGLAVAALFPAAVAEAAQGVPRLVLLAVTCSLLPDLLERMRRRLAVCDGQIVCDPLRPDAAMLAEGISRAAYRALETGRRFRLRLLPLPGRPGQAQEQPWVRLDAQARRIEAGWGTENQAQAVLPPIVSCWPNRLVVDGREGLLLEFRPGRDWRAPLHVGGWRRGWPHGLPFAALVVLAAGVFGGRVAAGVGAAALLSHLALDQGGMLGIEAWAPLRENRFPVGWRWWNGMEAEANASVAWAVGIALAGLLAHRTSYLPWRPSLPLLLLLAIVPPRAARRFFPRGPGRKALKSEGFPQNGGIGGDADRLHAAGILDGADDLGQDRKMLFGRIREGTDEA